MLLHQTAHVLPFPRRASNLWIGSFFQCQKNESKYWIPLCRRSYERNCACGVCGAFHVGAVVANEAKHATQYLGGRLVAFDVGRYKVSGKGFVTVFNDCLTKNEEKLMLSITPIISDQGVS